MHLILEDWKMTRNIVGLATAFALVATLSLVENCAWAQQIGTTQPNGDGSTEQAPPTPTQPTTAGEAQTESDRQNANYGTSPNQTDTQRSGDAGSTQQVPGQSSQNIGTGNYGAPQAPSSNQRRMPGDQSWQSNLNGQSSSQFDRNDQSQTNVDTQARVGGREDWRRGVQFDRITGRGLTVTNVERNNFFFDSGIRQDDVILSVDGRPIQNDADFFALVRPGARVPVLVLRDGRQETIFIQSPQAVAQSQRDYSTQQFQPGDRPYLGVAFDSRVRTAAIIAQVVPGGPAEQAGLQSGDEIVAINSEPVRSHQDAISIVGSMRPGDQLAVVFERRMENQADVVLGGQPGSSVRTTYKPTIPNRGDSVLIESDQYPADAYQQNQGWNQETDVNIGGESDLDRREFDNDRGLLDRDRSDYDRSEQPLRRRLLGR
jgi:hypothetical protein